MLIQKGVQHRCLFSALTQLPSAHVLGTGNDLSPTSRLELMKSLIVT
jgi:hypothetical protein